MSTCQFLFVNSIFGCTQPVMSYSILCQNVIIFGEPIVILKQANGYTLLDTFKFGSKIGNLISRPNFIYCQKNGEKKICICITFICHPGDLNTSFWDKVIFSNIGEILLADFTQFFWYKTKHPHFPP